MGYSDVVPTLNKLISKQHLARTRIMKALERNEKPKRHSVIWSKRLDSCLTDTIRNIPTCYGWSRMKAPLSMLQVYEEIPRKHICATPAESIVSTSCRSSVFMDSGPSRSSRRRQNIRPASSLPSTEVQFLRDAPQPHRTRHPLVFFQFRELEYFVERLSPDYE